MRRNVIAVCTTILFFQSVGWAGNLVITPTTTLSQQTSNNTSALNVFPARPNLNAAAGNVSKLDIHSLLYPGANTHIYAHLMLWFGSPKHMNVGYNSADSRQVKRQIEDMVSRGIEGVLIDWYGSGTDSDLATRQVIKEAELHPGFSVGIIVDVGTIKWNSCFGCSPQQALAAQLQYIERNYFNSPAYMRLDGRPVVSNFDVDLLYKIDWQAAKDAQWFHSCSDRRQLLVGDSHHYRLWYQLSLKFLSNRAVSSQSSNHWGSLQGIQRHAGELGGESHYGPAMRPDLVAHVFRHQESLQFRESTRRPSVGHLERL